MARSAENGRFGKTSAPFDDLSFHVVQKMRILHGKMNIGRVVTDGRAVTPELALTVAADLFEVLKRAGMVAS